MKIGAFDQSTKITGVSIFEDGELIKYWHIDSNIKENMPFKRIIKTRNMIKQIITENKLDYIILEQCQFQRNFATYQQLSVLQGALVGMLYDLDKPFTIVPPSTWKSFCGIKGKKRAEQKANTIKMVKEKFNLDVTEDEADSIGIGLWAVDNVTLEDK